MSLTRKKLQMHNTAAWAVATQELIKQRDLAEKLKDSMERALRDDLRAIMHG